MVVGRPNLFDKIGILVYNCFTLLFFHRTANNKRIIPENALPEGERDERKG